VSDEGAGSPRWQPLFGVGVFLLILAGTLWYEATRLPPPQTVGVGPSAGLRLVSVLLGILGVAHLISAWRRRAESADEAPRPASERANRAALGWVFGGLVGMMAILEFGGGFVLSATCLFACTATAFGQPLRVKSPLIGFVLAFLVYAFFTKALSLSLPAGPLEHLLLG